MRPLFGFFEALAANRDLRHDKDFTDGKLVSEVIRTRSMQALDQIGAILVGHRAETEAA